jgi:hypothetical protein
MDVKGLRTLNYIGTTLFGLIGGLLAFINYYNYVSSISFVEKDVSVCKILTIIWFCILISFTILLYKYAVYSLDRGEYRTAKTWTLIGVFVGFVGGIIPLIIFIISYVSFDDAIRTQQLDQTQYSHSQQISEIRYCNSCRRQIPIDSNLCPYCGVQQSPIHPHRKPPPPPPN